MGTSGGSGGIRITGGTGENDLTDSENSPVNQPPSRAAGSRVNGVSTCSALVLGAFQVAVAQTVKGAQSSSSSSQLSSSS